MNACSNRSTIRCSRSNSQTAGQTGYRNHGVFSRGSWARCAGKINIDSTNENSRQETITIGMTRQNFPATPEMPNMGRKAITEVSIAMREQFPDRTVAVLGYTNDHLGYLTTQEIYDQGGYEAGMGLCFPEATEEMFNSLVEMAQGMVEK